VELGWVEDPTAFSAGCPPTGAQPTAFTYAFFDNVVILCDNEGTLGAGTFHNFRVFDDDQNGVWQYWRGQTFLGAVNMGTFITGTPVSNGERRVLSDSARTNHDGLDRMNSSQNWTPWTNTAVNVDSDPDFRACIRSDDHVEVRQTC
jgi:hypothetical protein